MEQNITISKAEHLELLLNAEKLRRLSHGGVDNWEWYDESLNPDGEESFTEARERITKELEEKHPTPDSSYLGEEVLASYIGTPFEGYSSFDWAIEYIGSYGQIDGDHHKLWVLDQVALILLGTPVILKLAKWADGRSEYRFYTGNPSVSYLEFVKTIKGEGYRYDEGIAP